MANHLLLIDASGFSHRAYHAGPKVFREDGLPTGATLGFISMLWSLIGRADADKPTMGAAIFDAPGPKGYFRHDLFPDYKANRSDPAKRMELGAQMPYMRHAANAFGFETLECEGFEADDVIATLAAEATRERIRTTIVSQDKDFCQLVRDGWVEIIDPVKRTRVLEADVLKKFGVPPALVPDVQALWGDAADNIPGLPGIGAKTAGELIRQMGGLEPLLEAASQSGRVLGTKAIRSTLREHADDARLWRRLAVLRTDVPIAMPFHNLLLAPPETAHLKEILRVLGASHRFDTMFARDTGAMVLVKAETAPLLWWTKAIKRHNGMWPETPQDGFFKCRLVRGGVWVAARIWRDPEKDFMTGKATGYDVVHCEIAGKAQNAMAKWDMLARNPISQEDFNYLKATSEWAKQYAPNSSEANPSSPIDWLVEPLE